MGITATPRSSEAGDETESLGSDLAIFWGLGAAENQAESTRQQRSRAMLAICLGERTASPGRREWEKGKNSHIYREEAMKRASKGSVRSEDPETPEVYLSLANEQTR